MPDGKNESITAKKRRLFSSTHFLTSKKRGGPAVHEEKTGCACSCEDQGGQGETCRRKVYASPSFEGMEYDGCIIDFYIIIGG